MPSLYKLYEPVEVAFADPVLDERLAVVLASFQEQLVGLRSLDNLVELASCWGRPGVDHIDCKCELVELVLLSTGTSLEVFHG